MLNYRHILLLLSSVDVHIMLSETKTWNFGLQDLKDMQNGILYVQAVSLTIYTVSATLIKKQFEVYLETRHTVTVITSIVFPNNGYDPTRCCNFQQ